MQHGSRFAFRFIGLCAVLTLTGATARGQPEPKTDGSAPRRPNVVLIISDDLGYGDLGFQGGKDIPTPHFDALAASGTRFTNAYVTGPICGPTRAGLLSGRYQQRHSYDGNPGPNTGLNLSEKTLADAFRAGGYKTMAVGKWHLGGGPDYRPWNRGFDEFFGFYGAMHSYAPGEVAPSARMVFEKTRQERDALAKNPPKERPVPPKEPSGLGGGPVSAGAIGAAPGKLVRGTTDKPHEEVEENEYLTEAFAREAVAFIDRNKAAPFFLYLAFNASHSPLQPTKKYLDRFPKLEGKRKAYAATTSALDDAAGAVVAKLRALKLEEDTVIYFINDNGGPIDDIAANNAPLSGAKFSLWEGGIRVPAVISWKGKLAGKQVLDVPVSSLDAFPTLLAAAGLDVPAGKLPDGLNLLPVLKGGLPGALKERTLYWRLNQFWAVRSGDWKLVLPERGEKIQLFNLANDVAEEHDLSEKHPEVVKRLTANWKAWNEKNLPVKGGSVSPEKPNPEKK
ncbi:sulfatase-like hydrolase/transferase [Gemmata sp. JC717]|uniref:sulfatase-like hydrolase/transferase n=1 Tax=Gemmata algarum TaxID=2975278 RepID=UPI0021BAD395|nr:sulfatase-like hydrolase/transferase [Gemmata algarum]MDY3555029.1 sulfatase-like hydrolase/transferase [Gemmata algarum]